MIIDIHSHLLPRLDDGSPSVERSLEMLAEAEKQGVKKMILTPHFRRKFNASPEKIQKTFGEFSSIAKDRVPGVQLFLGQEFFVGEDYKKDISAGKALTMCGSDRLLVEFDFGERRDIPEVVYELKRMGFEPIVAHIERYDYADIDTALEVKSLGGLIQINADSVAGRSKRKYLRKVKKLFKEGAVDFVASDMHSDRTLCIRAAEDYIAAKFGRDTADAVFFGNAEKFICGR